MSFHSLYNLISRYITHLLSNGYCARHAIKRIPCNHAETRTSYSFVIGSNNMIGLCFHSPFLFVFGTYVEKKSCHKVDKSLRDFFRSLFELRSRYFDYAAITVQTSICPRKLVNKYILQLLSFTHESGYIFFFRFEQKRG